MSTSGRGFAIKVFVAYAMIHGGLATTSCTSEPILEATRDPRPMSTSSRAALTATAVITSITPTEAFYATDVADAQQASPSTDAPIPEGEANGLRVVELDPSTEGDRDRDVTSDSASEPVCRRPVEEYTRVEVAGETLNRRTVTMLETAMEIYDGPADLKRVAQGSFTDAVAGSFGTHDGGGAVDLSIRNPEAPAERLFDEVPAIIQALRQAGFAAWYRDWNEVFDGSVPHIHAIAIGDAELSEAARLQLDGPAGYFRGFNGLPIDPPVADGHGGPVVCDWMEVLDLDLR